jgi:hypothetical protein
MSHTVLLPTVNCQQFFISSCILRVFPDGRVERTAEERGAKFRTRLDAANQVLQRLLSYRTIGADGIDTGWQNRADRAF